MRIITIITKLAGVLALLTLAFSCSDDTHEAPVEEYGYAQFKLTKNGLAVGEEAFTRAADADRLDSLADAKRIKITLKSAYDVVEQTLDLSAVNNSETEQGLWSEKCKLLAGSYRVVGYELLDNLDKTILTYDQEAEDTFDVLSGGMTIKELGVNVRPRGLVKFQFVKDFSQITTRGAEAYRMDLVTKADITVKHNQTNGLRRITNVRTKIEYYYESETDKTLHGKLICDTVIPMKAGDYTATSFILYNKDKETLEASMVTADNSFHVSDNRTTVANVPITLQETAPNIQDGIVLKKIWEALDGPNWSFRGLVHPIGCNWDFDRDIDLWTAQPGVKVRENGRVASISLGGFGARGAVPEELGELAELTNLTIGSHMDGVGSSPLYSGNPDEMIAAIRADFKEISAPDYCLSLMSPEMWEVLPDSLNIRIQSSINRGKRTAAGLNAYANDPNNFGSAITSLPASIGKLKKLKGIYIANCPIATFPKELGQLENCTDVELYNCPNLKRIPEGLMDMPKLQMVYFVNNNGISSEQLYDDLVYWSKSASATTLQGLYFMNNNLKVVPDLRSMVKLGFFDAQNNQIEKFEAPFGKEHLFGTLNLNNNHLKGLPRDEFGYFAGYEAAETWSFSQNEFTEFPDIFDASSPFMIGTLDFSQNKITKFENGDSWKGVNLEILNLSFNPLGKFYKCIYASGSKINYLMLRSCGIRNFDKGCFEDGKYTFITIALDLNGNRITKIPVEFSNRTFPYMNGVDLGGNAFSNFPNQVLNVAGLQTLILRGQRNDEGFRCLREWPVGIYSHSGLRTLYLGSNDYRKIFDGTMDRIRNKSFELTDNPNLTIDLTDACPYIMRGLISFLFDPGQDVRGCDAIVPKN